MLPPTDCDSHQFRWTVVMHKPNVTSVSWKLLLLESPIKRLTSLVTPSEIYHTKLQEMPCSGEGRSPDSNPLMITDFLEESTKKLSFTDGINFSLLQYFWPLWL